jgi:hypothetical protein
LSPVPSLENDDWAGELGPFDPWLAILASVDVRSRLEAQFVEKTEGPNGPVVFEYWLRCGIEPARNLDSRAALLAVL